MRWYNQKEEKIKQMMLEDEKRDKILEAGVPPNIICAKCYQPMKETGRFLTHRYRKEEALFFMRCPDKCLMHKTVFQDGTEHKFKWQTCPKCLSSVTKEKIACNQHVDKTKFNCSNCDYEKIEAGGPIWTKEEKAEERDFKKNRHRFCLSGQLLLDTQEAAAIIENTKTLFDDLVSE
jgi:hypothetical protein